MINRAAKGFYRILLQLTLKNRQTGGITEAVLDRGKRE